MDRIVPNVMPVNRYVSNLRTVPEDTDIVKKDSRSADVELTGDTSKKQRRDNDDNDTNSMRGSGGKSRSSRKRSSKSRNLRRKSIKRHRRRTFRK